MISPKKFQTLGHSTRLRKTYRLLLDMQRRLVAETPVEEGTLALLAAAETAFETEPSTHAAGAAVGALLRTLQSPQAAPAARLRCAERALAALEPLCGLAPADWDLLPPAGLAVYTPASVHSIALYLEDLRSPFNIGSICRTAAAFGCQVLYLSPGCADERHPRCLRAAMGALSMLEIQRVSLAELSLREPGLSFIALETGGTPVSEFRFPAKGVLILGNEELGVASSTLAHPDLRRVSIPAFGPKATLNVGVAAGIALSWWRALSSGHPG